MRLLEVTLSTNQPEELHRFYVSFLGMREVERIEDGRIGFQAGSTRLFFTPVPLPAPLEWAGRYHFAFALPTGRFEAAVRWLGERTAPIANSEGQTRFHSQNWNADSVYFYDPQGNILELIARSDDSQAESAPAESAAFPPADDERRRMAGRPFNATEIEAVCEVGVCVGGVADAVAQLTERMPGLEVYSGAGSDTFTAVGDRRGLLIVVRRGRIWFPDTGVAAVPLPLDLLVEIKDGNTVQQHYQLVAPPYPFTISPTH